MTTAQRDRLQMLARNSQPVTIAALVALWHCSVATVRDSLALCGYVLTASAGSGSDGPAWYHPDHLPEPEPEPVPPVLPPAFILLKPLSPSPQPRTSHPLPVAPRSYREPSRRLPSWVAVDPLNLIADIEATKVTRTWLLANVEPSAWPHPHRTSCHDCRLLQPCLSLSRHRQATICEAVITQRRLDHANLPDQSDIHRTPARFGAPGSQDIRTVHLAENACLAAG